MADTVGVVLTGDTGGCVSFEEEGVVRVGSGCCHGKEVEKQGEDEVFDGHDVMGIAETVEEQAYRSEIDFSLDILSVYIHFAIGLYPSVFYQS